MQGRGTGNSGSNESLGTDPVRMGLFGGATTGRNQPSGHSVKGRDGLGPGDEDCVLHEEAHSS